MKYISLLDAGPVLSTVATFLIIGAAVFAPSFAAQSSFSGRLADRLLVAEFENADGGEGENESAPDGDRAQGETPGKPPPATRPPTKIPLELPAGPTPQDNAAILLDWLRKEGKLGDQDELSEPFQSGAVGAIFVERVRQAYKGVPVYESNLVILRRGDKLVELDGELAIALDMSVEPTITIEEALARAGESGDFENLAIPGEERLYVHYRNGESALVWRLEAGTLLDRLDVLMDAHSGALVRVVDRGVL